MTDERGLLPHGTVRVSDNDRDRTSNVLRKAYEDGRINDAQFDARLSDAMQAETDQQLAILTRDLGETRPDRVEYRDVVRYKPHTPLRWAALLLAESWLWLPAVVYTGPVGSFFAQSMWMLLPIFGTMAAIILSICIICDSSTRSSR